MLSSLYGTDSFVSVLYHPYTYSGHSEKNSMLKFSYVTFLASFMLLGCNVNHCKMICEDYQSIAMHKTTYIWYGCRAVKVITNFQVFLK